MTFYRGAEGTELWFDEIGPADAEPAIVLAGGPARHPVYIGDLAGFGENNRLVLPHLRGVGKSPAAQEPGRATWVGQAEDIALLDQALGGGPNWYWPTRQAPGSPSGTFSRTPRGSRASC